MYGCVHSGDDAPQVEAPDLTPAQNAASGRSNGGNGGVRCGGGGSRWR